MTDTNTAEREAFRKWAEQERAAGCVGDMEKGWLARASLAASAGSTEINGQLYMTLNNLFTHLGMEGCITADHAFVWDAMTALKRIDGGVHLDNLAVPVDPDAHRDDMLAAVQLLEDGEWAEHFAKTPIGMRLEDQITKLHSEVAASAGSEPVAPQGVAYADAHGAIMGAAYDFRDAHISGSPNQKRSAHAALESAVTHALRASNGQAPAGATAARSDALCDSSYVAGAKAGFNLGVGHDYDALSRLVEGRHGYLQVLAATRPLPAPTAQAAPAATDPAYSEACSLATALFEKHYRQEPDYASGRVVWSLCDTTAGVISQIDNMVSGLVRAPAAGAVAGIKDWAAGARFALEQVAKIDHICWLTDAMREIGITQAGKAVLAERDRMLAAAPTQAAQADSAPAEAVQRIVHLRADRERRVYVAGPMTGLPEYNFPLFNATAAKLRGEGWHVENPAEHGHVEGACWADYLRWDISRIATCGAIYLLDGWEKSKGARLEVHIAGVLGLRVLLADGAEVPPADSVLVDAARESEYQRGYRHGYEQRDAEVRGALA